MNKALWTKQVAERFGHPELVNKLVSYKHIEGAPGVYLAADITFRGEPVAVGRVNIGGDDGLKLVYPALMTRRRAARLGVPVTEDAIPVYYLPLPPTDPMWGRHTAMTFFGDVLVARGLSYDNVEGTVVFDWLVDDEEE